MVGDDAGFEDSDGWDVDAGDVFGLIEADYDQTYEEALAALNCGELYEYVQDVLNMRLRLMPGRVLSLRPDFVPSSMVLFAAMDERSECLAEQTRWRRRKRDERDE